MISKIIAKTGLLELAYEWGARPKVGGAKDSNFIRNPLFCSNFGEISAKVGVGAVAPPPAPLFPTPLFLMYPYDSLRFLKVSYGSLGFLIPSGCLGFLKVP